MTYILSRNLSGLLSPNVWLYAGQKGGNILWNKETILNLFGGIWQISDEVWVSKSRKAPQCGTVGLAKLLLKVLKTLWYCQSDSQEDTWVCNCFLPNRTPNICFSKCCKKVQKVEIFCQSYFWLKAPNLILAEGPWHVLGLSGCRGQKDPGFLSEVCWVGYC